MPTDKEPRSQQMSLNSFLPNTPSNKRNESGGRTLKITLTENNQLVYTRVATLTGINQGGVARYTTDDGDEITLPDSASRKAVWQRLLDKY